MHYDEQVYLHEWVVKVALRVRGDLTHHGQWHISAPDLRLWKGKINSNLIKEVNYVCTFSDKFR